MKHSMDNMRTSIIDSPVKRHEASLEQGWEEGFRQQARWDRHRLGWSMTETSSRSSSNHPKAAELQDYCKYLL